jgi:hypothetical protein
MGNPMVAREPWIKADGNQYVFVSGVHSQQVGDAGALRSNPLVQALNGLDAQQKHRGFRNNLFAQKSPNTFCSGVGLRIGGRCLGNNVNHLAPNVKGINDSPDQVRLVPAS